MQEKDIERKIREIVKSFGGITLKIGYDGWPDRIVLMPKKPLFFLEIKKPGGRLSYIQRVRYAQLTGLGHNVYVVYSSGEFSDLLKEY